MFCLQKTSFLDILNSEGNGFELCEGVNPDIFHIVNNLFLKMTIISLAQYLPWYPTTLTPIRWIIQIFIWGHMKTF